MAFPPVMRKYVIAALAGAPDVLDSLLKPIPPGDPRWDLRPDPARFTLREVMAHLADWNPIYLERMTRTRDEEKPFLVDYDEGRIAVERDYAHSDPHANRARFREGRAALIAFLRGLPDAAFERAAHRENVGDLSIEAQAAFALGHDGYHLQQVAEWLAAGR